MLKNNIRRKNAFFFGSIHEPEHSLEDKEGEEIQNEVYFHITTTHTLFAIVIIISVFYYYCFSPLHFYHGYVHTYTQRVAIIIFIRP